MDRNNMRSSYVSGPRSLPHMGGSKRHNSNGHSGNPHGGGHNGNGHNGNGHNGNGHGGGHNGNGHGGNGHSSNGHGHNGARLSPPSQSPPMHHHHHHHHQHYNNSNSQQEDLINFIYDSWNTVTREIERGSQDAKYYQEVMAPRQLANFRPFNLEEWWGRRLLQTINRKHRS